MGNQQNFCVKCGKPLQPGQNFCANCGFKLTDSVTNSSNPMLQQNVPVMQPVKKMKKKFWIWFSVGTAVVLALIIGVAVAVMLNTKAKDRTIMVYMIGSNLESEGAAASLDINEMKGSSFDGEHTKILLYTGGSEKWALDEISPDENAIFEVADGQINKVKVYEKSLMTEPQNVVDFVNFAYENYSADLYDLIFWDHGGGPIFGYGQDGNSLLGKAMKIPALTKALAETELVTSGKKFDLIGFDACLMGSAEVAKAFSKYGDYMIASEEVEPGNGWSYGFLNALGKENPVKDTKELGQEIIDQYIDSYKDYAYDVDLSMALIDLKKIDQLVNSMDELFSEVKDGITEQSFSQYSRLMTRDKVYGYAGRDNRSYDLVDLVDLCESLRDEYGDKVDKIRNDFDDIVLYNKSNMDNANGLSVYFLNYNKKEAEKMLVDYKDVALSDEYYNFLIKYKGFVAGDRRVSRAIYDNLDEKEVDGGIEIELPDELRDNYQSGEIIIFRKLGDNKYMPVYRSSEVGLSGNMLRATTYNLQFVIEATSDEGTEYGWAVMYEKERTADYADYVTLGVLWYEDGSNLGIKPKSYEMHIRVPKGETEAQVRDIRVRSDNELASKMSFDPEKINIIDFTIGAYKLFDDAGKLDYNMESHGTLYGTSVNLKKNDKYRIKLVGLDFDFGNMYDGEFDSLDDYYAGFIVHDTQGDSHRLNLVHINK
ncbi:zinc-ribbon domain-containing protein [Candidatus Saccharibacteria bacterium]|nr:zinc-ribbon domain-containing protein [Candidatus Saccharibacteria bacterium]